MSTEKNYILLLQNAYKKNGTEKTYLLRYPDNIDPFGETSFDLLKDETCEDLIHLWEVFCSDEKIDMECLESVEAEPIEP